MPKKDKDTKGDKGKKAPTTIVANSGNAFTTIEDYEDGTDPKGVQLQMTRSGPQRVEFVMTKWPLWNAITNKGDIEFVRNEISKEGFADIDLQQPDHPVYHNKTYLIAAVQANRLEIVKLLLQHNANPNLLDDSYKTAAHYAVILNYKDIFDELVKSPKINLNLVINNNNALLHLLMSEGKKDWGQTMVDLGADINLHTEDLATPLVQALGADNTECARWLIELGADVKTGFDGISPMCFAASSSMVEVMGLLLERGASLHKEGYNTTPLHAAARNNKIEAVKFLLDKGADVNAEDSEGETAIMAGAGFFEIVTLLIDRGATIDPSKPVRYLFNAATNGSSKSLALFLDTYKMDVNAKNNDGQNALFEAATCDACDSPTTTAHIDELLKHGIDVNCKETSRGTSALLYAVFNRKAANVAKLLQANANPNTQDKAGLTPLHMACGRGMLEEALQLVAGGADKNAKDENGESPLDYAANTFGADALNGNLP